MSTNEELGEREDEFDALAKTLFYQAECYGEWRSATAKLLRARFGECVEALEMIAKFPCGGGAPTDYHCGECAWCVAKDTLASLRGKVKP